MRALLSCIASAWIIGAGCARECTDAAPAVLLEIVADDPSLVGSLEVTLEFEEHRFRRLYALADQLEDGRTTIEVDLDPPPSQETELRVAVRSYGAGDQVASESSMVVMIRPDACNELTLRLGGARADAGVEELEDAGSIEDAGAADAQPDDAGIEDAQLEDAQLEDAASEDAASEDAQDGDAAGEDAALEDAGFLDAGSMDALPIDAGAGPTFREVTIDNMGGPALTNYVLRVVIDSADPIHRGRMQPNGADIRFYAADRVTPLDFWIDTGIGTATTAMWVEVPSIPAGTSAIHLWYGDPTASPASDGDATFPFFADFDSAPLGDDGTQEGLAPLSGIWSVVAGGYRGNGYQEIGTPSRMSVSAGGNWADVAVSVKVRLPSVVSSGVNGLYLRMIDPDNVYFFGPFQQNGMTFGRYSAGAYSALGEIVTAVQRETWHDITIAADGTRFRGYLDGTLVVSTTDGSFASGGIGLRTWGTNVRYDDLRVRPYRSPEPVTAVGPEE